MAIVLLCRSAVPPVPGGSRYRLSVRQPHRPSAAAASVAAAAAATSLGSSIRARVASCCFQRMSGQRFAAQISMCFEPVSPAKARLNVAYRGRLRWQWRHAVN
jgi:hypothetical protein